MLTKNLIAARYIITGLLIFAMIAAGGAWLWRPWVLSAKYTIRAVTGPVGSDAQKFLASFKQELANERPRVRLALTETKSLDESAESFLSGKFDLATVRSDHRAAANGGTIAILRREAIVVMVPANSSVKSMKHLVGKKIVIPDSTAEDDPLLKTVLAFYGLRPTEVIKGPAEDVGALLKERKAAAVMTIGIAGPGEVAEAVKSVMKATRKPPRFIELEAKQITARSPIYEEIEIPRAAFLATPPVPDDDLTTIAFSVRIVARNSMLDIVAGEITRLLLATRAKLAVSQPNVAQIEAPDTDKNSVLIVHPGAAAYLDGDQESYYDRAMNQLFNVSIIGGMLGSVALSIGAFWRKRRLAKTNKDVARLVSMLSDAKSRPFDELNDLEEELDSISGYLLEQFAREEIQADKIYGVSMLVSELRALIERRRRPRPQA